MNNEQAIEEATKLLSDHFLLDRGEEAELKGDITQSIKTFFRLRDKNGPSSSSTQDSQTR